MQYCMSNVVWDGSSLTKSIPKEQQSQPASWNDAMEAQDEEES